MRIRKIYKTITPPAQWKIPVFFISAVLFGLIFLVLHIANATSYLSNDPKACINCHVMTTQYISWMKSSHARVAVCSDCHVPQDNILRTYSFKASDGIRHATMFTLRLEPQVIRIKEAGANVVQENCIRCHEKLIQSTIIVNPVTLETRSHGEGRFCWDCHRETPHGSISSLSAYPHARVPQLSPILPQWLERFSRGQIQNNN